jgi:hypothetical protein
MFIDQVRNAFTSQGRKEKAMSKSKGPKTIGTGKKKGAKKAKKGNKS